MFLFEASAVTALQAGLTHYEAHLEIDRPATCQAAGGSPALREKVARHLERSRPGLRADPEKAPSKPFTTKQALISN